MLTKKSSTPPLPKVFKLDSPYYVLGYSYLQRPIHAIEMGTLRADIKGNFLS